MSEPELCCVLTTIAQPTDCVRRLAEVAQRCQAAVIVVGDRKGPAQFDLAGTELLTLDEQRRLPFDLARQLPVDHYARKNVGYLSAIAHGARCIYETDDDNMPTTVWQPRTLAIDAQAVTPRPWMNVYRVFSSHFIWPRGFPLEQIADARTFAHDPQTPLSRVEAPIQQGLVDGAPDTDAIWRLLMDQELNLDPGPSLYLPPGTWCPFNSQSTWWWPVTYPLLYLPSHCSFRMTDIWRSFIAQRCVWELGQGVAFHAAEVVQLRNAHNLLHDFRDEVPGYLHNARITEKLGGLSLRPGPGAVADNLLHCYEALVADQFLPAAELELVETWIEHIGRLMTGGSQRSAA